MTVEEVKQFKDPSKRYSNEQEYNQGGMGKILWCFDESLAREIAIKIPHTQEQLQNIMHEARYTGMLEHPNIVPIHEIGVLKGKENKAEDNVYFTMS